MLTWAIAWLVVKGKVDVPVELFVLTIFADACIVGVVAIVTWRC